MLDIIKSMYENVRSRVKYNNTLSDDFSWGFFRCQYVLEWYRGY